MCGDGHDRAGAVAHEHIVGDPDGNALAVDRIDGERAGEDPGFLFVEFGAVEVALRGDSGAVIFDSFLLLAGGDRRNQRMLGRENHVGRAEKRVGPGGENLDPGAGFFLAEFHGRAFAAADPISLEKLDALGPVEAVEFFNQTVGEGRDAQHPLAERAALDGKSSHLALAIHDLLVRKHGAELRTPIHRHLGDIREAHRVRIGACVARNRLGFFRSGIEPRIVKLQENPLRPTEVAGVGRADFAVPIVAEADRLELATEVVDVAGGGDARVLAGFDGELLGGQAEGIPAHRVQDIEAPHPVEARENIRRGVALDMADMEAVAARVGEHVENVELRLGRVEALVTRVFGAEGTALDPLLLPLGFELREGKLLALRRHRKKREAYAGTTRPCKSIRGARLDPERPQAR